MSAEPERTLNGRGATLLRRALGRVGIAFRAGEAGPAALLFLTFFLIITFQYATKSVRQSAFISGLGAEQLPWVYLFVAAISYPFLRVYSGFADRMKRETLIISTCTLVALSMALFWWLFEFPWRWVPFAFYVWISIAIVMLVSQFWSFANHLFDPRQAKRLFAFVGAGGLLGGIVGGQVAKLATKLIGTRYALLVAAALLLLVVALIWLSRRIRPGDDSTVAGASGLARLDKAKGGFEILRQSAHLRWVATIMVLTVVVAQVVDLQFNWAVQESTTSLDQRTSFFGNFYSIVGIAALLFQLVFTARIHRTLGVGFAMRVLPVSMGIGTLALIVASIGFPEMILAAALVLKTGENGFRYSVDQATRELLFLPIPSRSRVRAKAFIDVFVQRGAKGIAALLLLPVTFGIMTAPQAGWISLALIAIWLASTVATRHQYVESFRSGLRHGGGGLDSIDLTDATALELVVQSLGRSEPRQVVQSIHLLRKHDRAKLVPPLLLYHDDPGVRRATLEAMAAAMRRDAANLVERCLADEDLSVRAEAVRTLAILRNRDSVEMMLPLLDSGDPGLVSAAVVALANEGDESHRERAAVALNHLMESENAAWRAEAAKAIGHLQQWDAGEALVLLLSDRDREVVREAIAAAARCVSRSGANPLWTPALISLLDDRRLKHDARNALIAFGEPVIPALLHFMNSPDERLWVRRALPRTIAMIGGAGAISALAASLREARDPFLVRKLIEGLGSVSGSGGTIADHRAALVDAVNSQCASYFRALSGLAALGTLERARFAAPFVAWDGERYHPSLLEQLLAERMTGSMKNLFGLLLLLYERRCVTDAQRALTAGGAGAQRLAVEYLDNVLDPAIRRVVLPVIDERPLGEKLEAARALFGITVSSRTDLLAGLVEEALDEAGDGAGFGAAALFEIYSTRHGRLYPSVQKIRTSENAEPLARETAEWISRKIDLTAAV
ncbi:MAG: Npt1/Npt2 family nucleotide transporter [Thermoanaerobaculia bacterium]